MKTQTLSTEQLLQQMNWRYATKKFDPSRKIDVPVWDALEKSLVLTPSSYGLQPWKALVITSPAVRETLKPLAWNQSQVTDCSHFVVIASRKTIGLPEIEKFLQLISDVRGVAKDSLAFYRDMMVGDLVNGPRSRIVDEWARRQAYIALGNLLTSAAMLGVDACPMEGFLPDKFDEVLGLSSSNFGSIVSCALGYRAADDKYAALPKVRPPASEIIQKI
jgi:nitroreductase